MATDATLATAPDPRAREVLTRCCADTRGEMSKLVWRYLPHLLTGRPLAWERLQHTHDDSAIALAPP